MGVVNTAYTFQPTDVITSSKMNDIIDQTVITGTAISGTTLEVTTSGQLKVRAQNISSNELATDAVTSTKIFSGSVEPSKLSTGYPSWTTTGNLTVNGSSTSLSSISAGTASVSIGSARTASGASIIDFNSTFPLTSYEARISRESGADGDLVLTNTGNGTIKFNDTPLGTHSGVAPIYGARAWAKCTPMNAADNSQAFKNGSYSAAVGTVVTVTIVGHNLKADDKIRLVFTKTSGSGTVPSSSTVFNVVSKISNDVFTVAFTSAAISSGTVVAWFVKVVGSQNVSSVTFYNSSNTIYVVNFDVPMPTSDFATCGTGQLYPGSYTSFIAEYNDPGTLKLNTVNNAYIGSTNDNRFMSVIFFA